MTVQAVLAPLFAQVLLTFVLLVAMGRARIAAARAGDVKVGRGSPRGFAWPEKAAKVSDCFHNQLELPPLFYAVVTLALVTKTADLVFVGLCWVFVALRYLHAFEHVGTNRVRRRFSLFLAGAIALMALWIWFALKVFIGL
ncbi:MAPEG family protein [Chenggangzhangella methanolivorans]|uniref:MAPEG family protein n=1 Tax=Chenggangzhangella methanolivorans TaxID=1437009 RepID=A0A9E6REW7_9HYPH|nr:MAPEG family protein [Chenggangzhangella methanolivorans]QZN99661.1 MAPEG family protein [Chenggangzhangella methanolivorans]